MEETPIERTDAEIRFDELVASRRRTGRATYGQGLEASDKRYSWPQMALEEALDLGQYLAAENVRLMRDIENFRVALNNSAENGLTWKAQYEKKELRVINLRRENESLRAQLDAARAETRLMECRLIGERPA
jgi:cell shape-determining protein MreC